MLEEEEEEEEEEEDDEDDEEEGATAAFPMATSPPKLENWLLNFNECW